jgi:hypothetical protein
MTQPKSSYVVRTDAGLPHRTSITSNGETVKLTEEEAKPLLEEGKVSKG